MLRLIQTASRTGRAVQQARLMASAAVQARPQFGPSLQEAFPNGVPPPNLPVMYDYSPEVMALREKEKGDWKLLTKEEKVKLYRATYNETREDQTRDMHGGANQKAVFAGTLLMISCALCFFAFLQKMSPGRKPIRTMTPEWKAKEEEVGRKNNANPFFRKD